MTQAEVTGIVSLPCTQDLGQYLRVKNDGTYGLGLAGASDEELGTVSEEFVVSGLGARSVCPVVTPMAPGLHYMIASTSIAQFGDVYAAASGKVASSGTVRVGKTIDAATASGDIIRVLRFQSTQVATAGTTGSSFTVDSDAETPKLAIAGQTGGTGNYTTTIKPETTLSADNAIVCPEADGDTLVAVALAQTLTNKTLTSPVLTTPQINDTSADHQYVFAVSELTADRTVTLPLLTGNDTFVFAAFTQTLTNKTLTAPTITSPVVTEAIGASTSAAGSTSADAGALPAGTARVYPTTAADDTVGVIIHDSDKVTGRMLFIGNGVANKILKVYPPAGGTINGGSANAAFSTASGHGAIVMCTSSGDNTWLGW